LPSWTPASSTAFVTQLEATIMSYNSEFASNKKRPSGSTGDSAHDVEGGMKAMLLQNTFNPQDKVEVLQKKKFPLAAFAKQVALFVSQVSEFGL
jgi:hypothetical protein